jgi:biotin carboxylase
MVFHRDEPAHPGGAHGHGGHHRHRSGALADSHRQWRALHGAGARLPPQEAIPRNGYAVQCRITTEDPENKFTPNYGKILTYRSRGGFGIRLDGGMGDTGASSRRFTIRCW